MKKALAIAAALALLLTLTACANKKSSDAPGLGDGPPFDELSYNLWKSLKGVWVHAEDNRFVIFEQGEQGLLFTVGVLASGYARTAVLESAEKDGDADAYHLKLHYPAVAGTETTAAMDEHVAAVYLDASSAAEKSIAVGFEDGSAAVYDLLGDSLEEATAAVFGDDTAASADGAALWSELAGVWANTDDEDYKYHFLWFTVEEGAPCLTVGLFASDYGERGALEKLEKLSENEYKLALFFAAVPASEMYDAREAYSSEMIINTSGAAEKTILVTFQDSDTALPFDLMGATIEEAANASGVYS